MNEQTIEALRAALARSRSGHDPGRVPLGHAGADSCLKGGLARGALHEVFAPAGHEPAATGFAAALGHRLSGGRHLLWIRQDFSALEHGEPAATGFLELGLDPAKILVLRVHDAASALRAASDALTCAALGAVVIEVLGAPKVLDLTASRRLLFAAAQKNVAALLLRFGADADASAAETRWIVAAAPSDEENKKTPVFSAELARNRHGRTGHWVMQWSSDDGRFQQGYQTDRGAVVCPPADRPAAAVELRPVA